MSKFGFKLFAASFVTLAVSGFIGSKVFGQAVLNVSNVLLDPTMARNYTYNPVAPFSGSLYDNDGFLVVGLGEFQKYNLVLTFDSPTPSINLVIEHGNLCGNISPGDFSDVDNPSDTLDATTFILGGVIEPPAPTTLNNWWQAATGVYNCASPDINVTVNNLTPLSDGRYGGYFYATMAPRASGSHQNSFKLRSTDPSSNVGYVSEVVSRLRNHPANAPFLSFVGLSAGQEVGINLDNVGQPQFAYSHFNVGMSVPCNSQTNGFSTQLGFYDMDDISGAGAEPGTATGGWWQGTATTPTSRVVVYQRPKGAAAWSVMTNVAIQGTQGGAGSGLGSGRASEFVVNVGPFYKDYQYQFELQNITRPNAVQFTIKDRDANLSTTAYEEPCGQDPIGFADDCEIVSGQTVIYGWAYDNDDSGGPQVQLNLSGIGGQTVTANLGTYASWQNNAAINSALNTWGYGSSARDNRYGWSATFSGTLSSGSYNLSGTVLDAGAGANPNKQLGINGGVFLPGGGLPDRCKFTPPPPTVDLDINGSDGPLSIFEGANVNVSWTSTDATGCTASRAPQGTSTWSGNKAVSSGGENHNADSATLGTFTYNITCTGLGGSGSDAVVLTVRQIPNKPYFQVLNGDVSAGTGFGSSCTIVGTAPIAAYNNGSPGYFGASTRLAAFDLGSVTSFASAVANPSLTKPKSLTFANTGGSEYGGGLSANACAIDYYNLPKTNAVAWGGTFSNGEYTSGSVTLAAGGPVAVGPDNKVTLFVNGDAYIRNNITLSSATTYNAMPTFYLIARGNIYIDYRVTQLDGVYVAQASGAANGKIFTCTTSAAVPTAVEIATSSVCGANQLTVNGALAAKQIKFLRSRSKVENCTSLANCLTESAEIINYTPDTWIPPRASTPGSAKKYDAITSLPPIL